MDVKRRAIRIDLLSDKNIGELGWSRERLLAEAEEARMSLGSDAPGRVDVKWQRESKTRQKGKKKKRKEKEKALDWRCMQVVSWAPKGLKGFFFFLRGRGRGTNQKRK